MGLMSQRISEQSLERKRRSHGSEGGRGWIRPYAEIVRERDGRYVALGILDQYRVARIIELVIRDGVGRAVDHPGHGSQIAPRLIGEGKISHSAVVVA